MNLKNPKFKIAAVLLVVLIASFVARPFGLLREYYFSNCPGEGPQREQELQISLLDVDLDAYLTELWSFAEHADVDITAASSVDYAGRAFDTLRIDFRNGGKRRLLVFAATHGNEAATALVIPRLLHEITTTPSRFVGWDVRILTPVNPVGLAYQSRYDGNGCDINRDFRTFATEGAKLQRDALVDFQPDIIVSLHEGPQDGFLVILEDSATPSLEAVVERTLQEHRWDLAEESFLRVPLRTPGTWKKTGWVYTLQRILGIDTLGSYARALGIPTLTTESSWTLADREQRLRPHLDLLSAVLTDNWR